MIRLVVADDQDLVRAGLRAILESAPDMTVVAEAADGAQAARLAREHSAHVVLMDVQMAGTDGLTGIGAVAAAIPSARVVMLTMYDLDDYVSQALRTGASGFLLKTTPPEDLLAAVRRVHAGEHVLGPTVTARLVESFVRRPTPSSGVPEELSSLTERELEVFDAIAQGLSNAEISEALFLSEATVKTYVTRILAKLGVRDRVRAVILAYECGRVG